MALPNLLANNSPAKQFAALLVRFNLIKTDVAAVLSEKTLAEIENYLITRRIVLPENMVSLYSQFFGLPIVDLNNVEIERSGASILSEDLARKYKIAPYKLANYRLHLAIGDPKVLQSNAPDIIPSIKAKMKIDILLEIAIKPEQVDRAINLIYNKSPSTQQPENTTPILSKQLAVKEDESKTAKKIDLSKIIIPQKYLKKIPFEVARKYKIICFGETVPRTSLEVPMIKVAVVEPNRPEAHEIFGYIEMKKGVLIDRYEIDESSFDQALKQYNLLTQPPPPPPKLNNEPSNPTPPLNSETIKKTPDKPVSQSVVKNNGVELVASDINSSGGPGTSNGELEKLMKEQDMMLENQNLDQLLKYPIANLDDLANVYKRGFIPEIVAATMMLAVKMQASDVHIEAQSESVRVRYRIDGILHDIIKVPKFLHAPFVSRIKILSKLKIDEQRVPQDGRFEVVIDKREVDVRVSSLPTVHGEKIVMRLLDKSGGVLTLEQLGVTDKNFDILVQNINKPYGIILSTGPTGSGKSTTLYAILNRISKSGINIITLEDPVEYELTGINQVQVKPQIGFTFAEGLRSVLRQDPNVIMVGEIRDLETAALATHAALTGHLVLSTLHTNDASGALPRLINMGVEPFLITSSINAVIGQRLVRKICDHCKQPINVPGPVLSYAKEILATIPSGQLRGINPDQIVFYHGAGCQYCNSGYKGRIGIFEVLAMNEKIEEMAVNKRPASDIAKAAVESGMITMVQDGLLKAVKGITTIDEVLRVTTTNIKEVPGG